MRNAALQKRLAKIREKKRQPKDKYNPGFPNLRAYVPPHELSNTIALGGFKKDKTTEHRWKKGSEEKPETIKEIAVKAKRIRPKFGKGAYEYATDGDNSGPVRIYQKGG